MLYATNSIILYINGKPNHYRTFRRIRQAIEFKNVTVNHNHGMAVCSTCYEYHKQLKELGFDRRFADDAEEQKPEVQAILPYYRLHRKRNRTERAKYEDHIQKSRYYSNCIII